MAYRELGVIELREVWRRYSAGDGVRAIARGTGVDRKTVAKYVVAAVAVGLHRGAPSPTDAQLAAFVSRLRAMPVGRPAERAERLAPYQPQIQTWLAEGLRLTKIHRRLREQGVGIPYSSLHRFAQAHCGFQRALYSVPTRYIGDAVDVRGDSRLVRIYLHGELIKVHPPQPPGGRATDYTDYPAALTPYAMRAPDTCLRRATDVGPAVGQFVTVLLSGPFPWARLRQAQKLLRLAERYGPARVNAACARALAFDLVEVRRVEAIVRSALEHEPPASARGTVVPLPARFARPPRSFAHHPQPPEEE